MAVKKYLDNKELEQRLNEIIIDHNREEIFGALEIILESKKKTNTAKMTKSTDLLKDIAQEIKDNTDCPYGKIKSRKNGSRYLELYGDCNEYIIIEEKEGGVAVISQYPQYSYDDGEEFYFSYEQYLNILNKMKIKTILISMSN